MRIFSDSFPGKRSISRSWTGPTRSSSTRSWAAAGSWPASPRRLAELKIYAFKRYQDHRRFLDMEREHVRRVLARS